MTDWEERMSQKAKARAEERARLEREAYAEDERLWHEQNDSTVEAVVDKWTEEYLEEMTVKQFLDQTPIACACVGPPGELRHLDHAPCFCAINCIVRERVKKTVLDSLGDV